MAIDTPNETAAADTVTAAPAAAATPQTEFKVSLEHFATQLSSRDKRVALIHGWVHSEKVAKRFRDLPSSYQARFKAFETQPA
jgi:hypothetical protein